MLITISVYHYMLSSLFLFALHIFFLLVFIVLQLQTAAFFFPASVNDILPLPGSASPFAQNVACLTAAASYGSQRVLLAEKTASLSQ